MEHLLPYRLLDSGNCRKLEQAGPYKIIRPALNAFWKPSLPRAEWDSADAEFHRESSGGGVWNWKKKHADEWHLSWGGLTLLARPTNFGRLGFFAEQAPNWEWMRQCVPGDSGKGTHAEFVRVFRRGDSCDGGGGGGGLSSRRIAGNHRMGEEESGAESENP